MTATQQQKRMTLGSATRSVAMRIWRAEAALLKTGRERGPALRVGMGGPHGCGWWQSGRGTDVAWGILGDPKVP